MEVETFARWAEIDASPEVLASLRSDWTIHPLKITGIEVAAACMSGSEIHFAIAPEWRRRVISRLRTREFLAPLFEVHGFLTTRTAPDKMRYHFLERIGFVLTWNDGVNNHYFMHKLPFGLKEN